ncbi:MAG: RNA 2',3'-cyclic phosphodiesterase [Solirubrobacteraceae bacterium]
MSASGERARLFVALELPGEVRERLALWRDGIVAAVPGLRAVAVESLHVTLCFLGSVDVASVAAVAAACGVVGGMPAASLRVGRGLWLPPRRPRVLAVELSDVGGRLAVVQSALSSSLADGGWYTPEKRPFLAHVTVARVGKGVRVRQGLELPGLPDGLSFVGSTVTLFRSRLSAAGARYEGLASVETSTPQ